MDCTTWLMTVHNMSASIINHKIGPQGLPRSQGGSILVTPYRRSRDKGCQSKQECAKKFVPTYISPFPFSDRSLVLGLHIATGEVSTGRLLQAFNLSTPLHCTHHCTLHTHQCTAHTTQLCAHHCTHHSTHHCTAQSHTTAHCTIFTAQCTS